MDELEGCGEREDRGGVGVGRLGGREGEHRADALAAGEEAVAHGVLEPLGRGLVREAQAGEVALDLLTQVLGVRGGLRRPRLGASAHDSSASCPASRPRPPLICRTHTRVELGAGLGGDAGAIVDERGGAVGVELPGSELGGGALEALDEHVESVGLSHDSRHSLVPRRVLHRGCR